MYETKESRERHNKEIAKQIKTIKMKGFSVLKSGVVKFKGQEIDLSATNPDHLAIAYTTLKQVS